jgi:hypothetical protein
VHVAPLEETDDCQIAPSLPVALIGALCSSWQAERNKLPSRPRANVQKKGRFTMLILLIILLLVLGGGGGYYGHNRWGYGGGAGIGLGTVLLILLVAYMLGVFH